jgi:hypothetical protein
VCLEIKKHSTGESQQKLSTQSVIFEGLFTVGSELWMVQEVQFHIEHHSVQIVSVACVEMA